MASINGLPPAIIPGTQRTNKSSNKRKVAKNQQQQAVGQTSKVANAVAHSIQNVKESDIHKAQIQYDLPEGHARRAMRNARIHGRNESSQKRGTCPVARCRYLHLTLLLL